MIVIFVSCVSLAAIKFDGSHDLKSEKLCMLLIFVISYERDVEFGSKKKKHIQFFNSIYKLHNTGHHWRISASRLYFDIKH